MTKEAHTVYMEKLVKDFKRSGKSQKDFAMLHGLKKGKLGYWVRKLSTPKEMPPTNTENAAIPSTDFVPITLRDTKERNAPHLLIRLPSGVEIEIPL